MERIIPHIMENKKKWNHQPVGDFDRENHDDWIF